MPSAAAKIIFARQIIVAGIALRSRVAFLIPSYQMIYGVAVTETIVRSVGSGKVGKVT
jgi:hypothetical protein